MRGVRSVFESKPRELNPSRLGAPPNSAAGFGRDSPAASREGDFPVSGSQVEAVPVGGAPGDEVRAGVALAVVAAEVAPAVVVAEQGEVEVARVAVVAVPVGVAVRVDEVPAAVEATLAAYAPVAVWDEVATARAAVIPALAGAERVPVADARVVAGVAARELAAPAAAVELSY